MAGSKQKVVKQVKNPRNRCIPATRDSDEYYSKNPCWNFNTCDDELWPLDEEHAADYFWHEILPRLKEFEKCKWSELLVDARIQFHSIDTSELTSKAQRRLEDRKIEAESILSLRLTATHRIYGYMVGMVFNFLWFDPDHGDNENCVCRSRKKHT